MSSILLVTYGKKTFTPAEPVAVITLRARAPRKKVVWTDDTVDNEHMNKKKSKCCCIYEKPKAFGESDSEDSDEECEHCFGHVEKRHAQHAQEQAESSTVTTDVQDGPAPEPTATITLEPSPSPPLPLPRGARPARRGASQAVVGSQPAPDTSQYNLI